MWLLPFLLRATPRLDLTGWSLRSEVNHHSDRAFERHTRPDPERYETRNALAQDHLSGQSGAVRLYERVCKIALALPGVDERRSHGEPCFFVHGKRALCYFHDNHNDGRVSLWCPAPPGVQEEMVRSDPERFFKPPPSARGAFADWLGVYIDTIGDGDDDWEEIAAIVIDAYRTVAPKALVADLDRKSG